MQFNQSCAASSFIQKSLVDGYPRLRSLLLSTLSKLRRNTEHRGGRSSAGTTSDHRLVGGGGSIGVGGRPEDADQLLAAAQPLLEVYLARSLSRLNEPVRVLWCCVSVGGTPAVVGADLLTCRGCQVHMLFPEASSPHAQHDSTDDLGPPPSRSDIQVFVKVATTELRACRDDVGLAVAVAQGVVAATKLLVTKAQAATARGPRSVAVEPDWTASPVQQHNHTIVARLQQVVEALQDVRRPDAARSRGGASVSAGLGTTPEVVAAVASALLPAVDVCRSAIWRLVVRSQQFRGQRRQLLVQTFSRLCALHVCRYHWCSRCVGNWRASSHTSTATPSKPAFRTVAHRRI